MEDCGEWLAGQYVDDANKTVTMKLDELGCLLKMEWITHAYPHDWRTKKPIIFRATTQWLLRSTRSVHCWRRSMQVTGSRPGETAHAQHDRGPF
ncbi:MAG: hypothetical protein ACLVJ6_01505 [Merdibacter sp.]